METITKTVSFEDKETGEVLLLDVTGEYYSGSSGSAYNRNGDPGDEPEPAFFDISEVYDGLTDVTSRFLDSYALADAVLEAIEEDR